MEKILHTYGVLVIPDTTIKEGGKGGRKKEKKKGKQEKEKNNL